MKINPGVGVGALRFGQSEAEVEALIGTPDRVEEERYEGDSSLAWHYQALGLSIYFEADPELRLIMIDADSPEVRFDSLAPIGLDEEDLVERLDELGNVVLEEEFEELDRRVYDLVDTGVWFWVHKGRCDSVQVSVLVDDDDEYVWP
jgi:hypothetical protein